MSIPAFNGSLSYVFLESALSESHKSDFAADFPQKAWSAAVAGSSVKPFYQIQLEVVKSSGTALRSGQDEIQVASKTDGTYPVNAAAFESAADAQVFYNELDQLLAGKKAQHTLRETARLNEGGKIRVVGFQF